MDVRCENCQTEYELDGRRLKPSGLTVKCTACGHIFKVRQRSPTIDGPPVQEGTAAGGDRPEGSGTRRAETPSGRSSERPPEWSQESPQESPQELMDRADADAAAGGGAAAESRPSPGGQEKWLVRLETGEIWKCRELATLQQWIAAGQVGRSAEISKTGETWKRLGEIAELEDIFGAAETARQRRRSRPGSESAAGRARASSSAPAGDPESGSPEAQGRRRPTSRRAMRAAAQGEGPAGLQAERGTESSHTPHPRIVPARGSREASEARAGGEAGREPKVLTTARPQVAGPGAGVSGSPGSGAAGADPSSTLQGVPTGPGARSGQGSHQRAGGSDPQAGIETVEAAQIETVEVAREDFDARATAEAQRDTQEAAPSALAESDDLDDRETVEYRREESGSADPGAVPGTGGAGAHPSAKAPSGIESAEEPREPMPAAGEEPGAKPSPRAAGAAGAHVPFDHGPSEGGSGSPGEGRAASAAREGAPQSGAAQRRLHLDADGPSGPTGGLARGVPTDDVAFAGSPIKSPDGLEASTGGGSAAADPDAGDAAGDAGPDPISPPPRRRGGAARWILAASLLVMVGAAGVVYILVFSAPEVAGAGADETDAGPAAGVDAAPRAADEEEGEEDAEDGLAAGDDALERARAAIVGGDADELERAAEALEAGSGEVEAVAVRALVYAARAQLARDRAELGAGTEARELAREGDEHAEKARELASEARALSRRDARALTATGEARRLTGQRPRDVRRALRRAVAEADDPFEAELALARLLAEEGRERQAAGELEELAARGENRDPPDARPHLQLALLALARDDDEEADEHARAALAVAADHPVAEGVLEIVGDRDPVVAQDDPMPLEEGGRDGAQPVGYTNLVAEAESASGSGRCDEAVDLYRRALEIDPRGVEALAGLGFCYLDKRQFARARTRFEDVLDVAPRHELALYGVAEAYHQQGLRQRAVSAFERFLDAHPESGRADRARRRLDGLRADATDGASDPADASGGSVDESGQSADGSGEAGEEDAAGEDEAAAGDAAGEDEAGEDAAGEDEAAAGDEAEDEAEGDGEGEDEDEDDGPPRPFLSDE